MHVRGGAAHVHRQEVAQRGVHQPNRLHHCTRCGQNGSAHQLPDARHARRLHDMDLKQILNRAPGRFDVELIQPGVHVFNHGEGLAR